MKDKNSLEGAEVANHLSNAIEATCLNYDESFAVDRLVEDRLFAGDLKIRKCLVGTPLDLDQGEYIWGRIRIVPPGTGEA